MKLVQLPETGDRLQPVFDSFPVFQFPSFRVSQFPSCSSNSALILIWGARPVSQFLDLHELTLARPWGIAIPRVFLFYTPRFSRQKYEIWYSWLFNLFHLL